MTKALDLNQSLMLEFVEITLEMKSPAYLQCSKDYRVESTFTEKKKKGLGCKIYTFLKCITGRNSQAQFITCF